MKTLWSGARRIATMLVAACAASAAAQTRSQPATPAAAPVPGPSATPGELVPFWLVRPEYPHIARMARVRGEVIVALTVAADGRLESAVIEHDIPLLSAGVLDAARDSVFLCRGCTGPQTYRLTYAFGFADTDEAVASTRRDVRPGASTVHIRAQSPIIDHGAGTDVRRVP